MIEVEALTKSYRVHERPPGVGAALRSLFKRSYRDVEAVRGIAFRIAPGERVGFLGPNGAGKTTTLKMLAGLLAPTSGSARVGGMVPFERSREFLRSIMLVAGQKQQLLWDLPPSDTFELNRAIYGVSQSAYRSTRDELVELLKLEPLLGKPVRQLSLGERMKCELAAALLHRPRVLFLDEPTIGLDVTMQVVVRDFIRRYNERHGAAVLLTSHYMDDVAALCPRIIVIDRGQLAWDGPLTELVHKIHPEKRVVLKLARPVDAADVEALGARVLSLSDAEVQLRVEPQALGHVVGSAVQRLPVADLLVEDAPLEEVMATLFGRQAG